MATSSKLRVMISSRCLDPFPAGQTATNLSDVRKSLKAEIEAMEIAGKPAFEVWINEEAPPGGGTWDSWDTCLEAVKDCDVLLVVSNGNAGWADGTGAIGICHAELMAALATAPAKVRLISLDNVALAADAAGIRNKRFQSHLATQSLFRGGTVRTIAELKARAKAALHDAVLSLAKAGVRDASKGKFHSGAALDWSRLDFASRRAEMIRVLREALLARHGSAEDGGEVILQIAGAGVLCAPHAVPASLGVAAARELVGQPFLHDYRLAAKLTGKRGGPIHVIACSRGATETQASKLLGFPDATLVSGPFGVFAADPIQKVQFAFLTNCRDETTTRHALQRFFEWLRQTGEDDLVAERSKARARIVQAIAKEVRP